MIQNWEKKGLIYPNRAQIPTVWKMTDEIWRIFFADRTANNKSFIRYLDVEAGHPENIIGESQESLLPGGSLGEFDREGQMPSWILDLGSEVLFYYIGFSQRQDVPYQNLIGLAYSNDRGKTFKKYSNGPIIGTETNEPFFASTPCVIFYGFKFKMWYLSCTEWKEGNPPEPRYNIKVRESYDGINWEKGSTLAINYKSNQEGGICRPSIVNNTLGRMWYCYRNISDYRTNPCNSYRIGYAEQQNGYWSRKDDLVNLNISSDGFDSQMMAYPAVIEHENKYHMFYNGNQFGGSGLGYATCPIT